METTTNVLDSVFNVFEQTGEWISGAITDMIPIFYTAENGLSLLGILCLASLSISVAFLLIGLIQRFMKFGA